MGFCTSIGRRCSRTRLRGRARVGADFNLLATAVNLVRLATLGLAHTAGRGWALNPS